MMWLRGLLAKRRQEKLDLQALNAGRELLSFLRVAHSLDVPLMVQSAEHSDLIAEGLTERLQQFEIAMRKAGRHG